MMAEVVGEFFENPGEMRGEWRMPKFLSNSSSKKVNEPFLSPSFYAAGSCWNIVIYPNGISKFSCEGCIALGLERADFGPPVTVSCTLGLKKVDGTEERILREDGFTFLKQRGSASVGSFIERTSLENRKAELLPSETLTVTCTLKNGRLLSGEDSLFTRLWDLSFRFMRILVCQRRTDFVLKFDKDEQRVHRLILEESSPMFHRMLNTDMREAQTGEMDVGDLDQAAFNVVLTYIYSGDPKSLCTENALEVFKIAHLYELPQLAGLCTRFMQEDLTVSTACDLIVLATLYQETEMLQNAKDFFMRNANEVIKTEGWKRLKSEQPTIVSDLMESMIEKNLAKAAF